MDWSTIYTNLFYLDFFPTNEKHFHCPIIMSNLFYKIFLQQRKIALILHDKFYQQQFDELFGSSLSYPSISSMFFSNKGIAFIFNEKLCQSILSKIFYNKLMAFIFNDNSLQYILLNSSLNLKES